MLLAVSFLDIPWVERQAVQTRRSSKVRASYSDAKRTESRRLSRKYADDGLQLDETPSTELSCLVQG
jgi:hypothetical protein